MKQFKPTERAEAEAMAKENHIPDARKKGKKLQRCHPIAGGKGMECRATGQWIPFRQGRHLLKRVEELEEAQTNYLGQIARLRTNKPANNWGEYAFKAIHPGQVCDTDGAFDACSLCQDRFKQLEALAIELPNKLKATCCALSSSVDDLEDALGARSAYEEQAHLMAGRLAVIAQLVTEALDSESSRAPYSVEYGKMRRAVEEIYRAASYPGCAVMLATNIEIEDKTMTATIEKLPVTSAHLGPHRVVLIPAGVV